MTLTELTAMETAYHVLKPLDETGRRRALQWLADALTDNRPLAVTTAQTIAGESVSAPAVERNQRTAQSAVASPATARVTKRSVTKAKSNPTTSTDRGRKRKAAKGSGGGQRPYRRMPDPSDIMTAYKRIGTISGMAEHFDVPHHTVTHWARRLREQGYDIGRAG